MVVALIVAVIISILVSVVTLLEGVVHDAIHAVCCLALIGTHVIVVCVAVIAFLSSVLSTVATKHRS